MAGIPQITIDQQLAEIGVRRTPAQMHIEQQQMEMSIKTEAPHMDIERKNPSFKVSRKKIHSDSGLKSSQELSKETRDRGKAAALRASKTAINGGDAKKPGAKIAKPARSKPISPMVKKKESNIGMMSKGRPEVEWDKGYMHINWSKHSIVIDWDGEYMPKVTIDPKYSIEIYLRTEPYFRVRVTEGGNSGITGRLVDKAI